MPFPQHQLHRRLIAKNGRRRRTHAKRCRKIDLLCEGEIESATMKWWLKFLNLFHFGIFGNIPVISFRVIAHFIAHFPAPFLAPFRLLFGSFANASELHVRQSGFNYGEKLLTLSVSMKCNKIVRNFAI